jgi:hypothetical protein
MKYPIISFVALTLLIACTSKNSEDMTSREVKEALGSGMAWCLNYDENQTCSSVSRFKSISTSSAERINYLLSGDPLLKFVFPVTLRFTSSGLCGSMDEATLRAMTIYRTTNNLAEVTDRDRLFSDVERQRFLSIMKDNLAKDFGKEICYRFKVLEERDGQIVKFEEFSFIDDIKQPSGKRSIYNFFTQDSNNIRLRPEEHSIY